MVKMRFFAKLMICVRRDSVVSKAKLNVESIRILSLTHIALTTVYGQL